MIVVKDKLTPSLVFRKETRAMPEPKILEEFQTSLDNLNSVKDFLNNLYFSDALADFFQRPVLSLLITGCEYLIVNLRIMRKKYEATS